ncbi:MAG: hypothetical protein Q4D14_00955 [Bacteroidales bacterium]|nr:hypothetical protein [Bacteroidales bacterium]
MKFNKILASALLALGTLTANAQGMFEALRFTTPDINGTARYMGMAGAFGALGADASAIFDNPAALGVYHSSEVAFSVDVNPTLTQANWHGDINNSFHTRASFNNAGVVWAIGTGKERGYITSNFNFSYARRRNINRTLEGFTERSSSSSIADYMANYTSGLYNSDLMNPDAYNDINIGWLSVLGFDAGLIDPIEGDSSHWQTRYPGVTGRSVTLFEKGGIDEYNLGYGFNISEAFFFGASFSLMDINYSLETKYQEQNSQNSFYLHNKLLTSGAGWNFKLGVIFCPVDFLRVGLSFHTPTYYTLTDRYYATAASTGNKYELQTPEAALTYRYKTPMKLQASLGFIIGERAAIDVDYVFTNVKNGTRLSSGRFRSNGPFADEDNDYLLDNEQIAQYARGVHMIKAGAEIMLIPETLPLRLGVAYTTPVVNSDAQRNDPLTATHTNTDYFLESRSIYASCGLGYRHRGFGIDLAYLMRNAHSTYMPYVGSQSELACDVNHFSHNIDLTLSFRF